MTVRFLPSNRTRLPCELRGSRRLALLAFLGQYQHTHLCLLLLQLLSCCGLGLVRASPTHRVTGGVFDMGSRAQRVAFSPAGTSSAGAAVAAVLVCLGSQKEKRVRPG